MATWSRSVKTRNTVPAPWPQGATWAEVPARDILALMRGDKTIHEILGAAEDEL